MNLTPLHQLNHQLQAAIQQQNLHDIQRALMDMNVEVTTLLDHKKVAKTMWWGYLHQNRSVQLRRWFGDVRDYTEDCKDNPFVVQVVEPFEANTMDEANRMLLQKLGIDVRT